MGTCSPTSVVPALRSVSAPQPCARPIDLETLESHRTTSTVRLLLTCGMLG